MIDYMGNPPVRRELFALGKIAMVATWVFPALQALGVYGSTPLTALRAALAGAAILVAALFLGLSAAQLGRSLRVGLPKEETALKTHGIYRISRNPMYLGLYLAATASCILAPHWPNLLAGAAMVVVHHRIVLAEERFLEGRFGSEWLEYRKRVRRYL